MIGRLAALLLLRTVCLIQAGGVPQGITSIEIESGCNVTFSCSSVGNEDRFLHWYKQPLGNLFQTVASGVYGDIKLMEPFNNTRFRVHKENDRSFLTISFVNKEDEAAYFCQRGTDYSQTFSNATFLTVNDRSQQTAVHVIQSPIATDHQLGDSVTLQCSLLSKTKETSVQCSGEHRMFWFRAGSGNSHPGIIYTHRNNTGEDVGRSCVYRLSKTLQDPSDFGTYYCAVVTCGKILFGNGTQLDEKGAELEPVVLVLGGLLFCCVTLIFVLLCIIKKRDSDQLKGSRSVSQGPGHDESTADQSNYVDREENVVNYTALSLTRGNTGYEKRRQEKKDSVYSSVR